MMILRAMILLLGQLGGDVAEGGLEGILDRGERADDGDGDDGGDQAVFDRGGARLVLEETRENVRHYYNSHGRLQIS